MMTIFTCEKINKTAASVLVSSNISGSQSSIEFIMKTNGVNEDFEIRCNYTDGNNKQFHFVILAHDIVNVCERLKEVKEMSILSSISSEKAR